MIFEWHDKEDLEVDDMKIEINDEYKLDRKIEYFDACDLCSVSE